MVVRGDLEVWITSLSINGSQRKLGVNNLWLSGVLLTKLSLWFPVKPRCFPSPDAIQTVC